MVIDLIDVKKTYSDIDLPAVNGISFNVETGQIITLLGPSGCGKTTLLRLIAGLERLDSGEIILNKQKVSGENCWIPPEKRGIGMVFQDYALFPHLTVAQNVAFGLKNKDNQKTTKTLAMVGLTEYASKHPAELSGGQQQRVALARVIVRDPLVILFDEPFSNLDVNLRKEMRREVHQIIRDSNATAIFVTHDQEEALSISDRIIVMNQGCIEQVGTPREIYESPETCFVASFVGDSNILKGTISEDGGAVLTDIGRIPCSHTHNKRPRESVTISIRPDSFELDSKGFLQGKVEETSYKGETIDVVVSVNIKNSTYRFLTHIHPEVKVEIGDEVTFSVLPHFVSVINTA